MESFLKVNRIGPKILRNGLMVLDSNFTERSLRSVTRSVYLSTQKEFALSKKTIHEVGLWRRGMKDY